VQPPSLDPAAPRPQTSAAHSRMGGLCAAEVRGCGAAGPTLGGCPALVSANFVLRRRFLLHGRARATTSASAVGATRCNSRRGVHPQAASRHLPAALRCAGVRVDVAALPRGRVDEMLQEPSRPANISKIVSAAARAARGGCQASVGVCWRPGAAARRHRGGCRSRPRRSYFSINGYAAASTRPRTPARCERFHPPAPCPWSAG